MLHRCFTGCRRARQEFEVAFTEARFAEVVRAALSLGDEDEPHVA
jgi:hypothetical protein